MSTDSDVEKRVYPRFPVRVPIFISIDGGVFKKELRLQSRDVSGGGLSFVTRQRLPIDARSKLVVSKFGDFVESAHIEGVVVYIRRRRSTRGYCVGVEFTKFVDVEREALVQRLREAEAEAAPRAAGG